MGTFILGFIVGVISLAAAAWCFISWAIGGAEQSIREDMEYREPDNI